MTATKQIMAKQGAIEQSAAKRTATLHIPDSVTIDGQDWTVRRAWPAGDGRIAWEAMLPDYGIRVGYLDDHGVKVLDADRDPKLPGLAGVLAEGGRLAPPTGQRAVVDCQTAASRNSSATERPRRPRGTAPGGWIPSGFALPQVRGRIPRQSCSVWCPGRLHEPAGLTGWSRAWTESRRLGTGGSHQSPMVRLLIVDADP